MTASRAWAVMWLTITLVWSAESASAQERQYELIVGGSWMAPITLTTKNAELSTSSGGSRNLFETDSRLAQTFAVEGGFGVRLTRSVMAVASVSTGFTTLETHISGDFEGAPAIDASASLRELVIEGSAIADIDTGARAVPFISGGAGYLRYLDGGHPVGDPHWTYHLGAGLSYQLTPTSGIRAEARAVIRKLSAFDDELHVAPAAAGSLFVRF